MRAENKQTGVSSGLQVCISTISLPHPQTAACSGVSHLRPCWWRRAEMGRGKARLFQPARVTFRRSRPPSSSVILTTFQKTLLISEIFLRLTGHCILSTAFEPQTAALFEEWEVRTRCTYRWKERCMCLLCDGWESWPLLWSKGHWVTAFPPGVHIHEPGALLSADCLNLLWIIGKLTDLF